MGQRQTGRNQKITPRHLKTTWDSCQKVREMTCHNCERRTSWLRTRCRTCQTRLPAWYVVTVMAICAAIYVGFLLLENLF